MKKFFIFMILMGCMAGTAFAYRDREEYKEQALRLTNDLAAKDSARLVELEDSARLWETRVAQVRIERDRVSAALDARPVVRLPGRVVVDTMWMPPDTVEVQVTDEDEEYFDWEEKAGPFAIKGNVGLFGIPPTRTAVVNAFVYQVDDIPFTAHILCDDAPGLNTARVAIKAKDPFNLVPTPGGVTQEPSVCNSTRQIPSFAAFNLDIRTAAWVAPVSFIGGFALGKWVFNSKEPSYIDIY